MTAFDRDFEERMKDPSFAAAYAKERAAIDEIDALVNQLGRAAQPSKDAPSGGREGAGT